MGFKCCMDDFLSHVVLRKIAAVIFRHLQGWTEEPKQPLWAQICSPTQVLAQAELNAFMKRSLKPWNNTCIQCSHCQNKPFWKWNAEMACCANEDWKQFLLSSIIFHLKYSLSPAISNYPQTKSKEGIKRSWRCLVLQHEKYICSNTSKTARNPFFLYLYVNYRRSVSLF